jgi:hypothetical protein
LTVRQSVQPCISHAYVLVLLSCLSCWQPVEAAPLIWFSPLDPLVRPEVKYGGAPNYMDLFTADAPWFKASAHVAVFKIYPQWITRASDDDLKRQFADLNRRGIALALEYGVLTATATCGEGVEGSGGETLLKAATRIQKNGGILRYVAMDEPIYYSTLYTGHHACRWKPEQTAENVAANVRAMLDAFPEVQVGDIEPLVSRDQIEHYKIGIHAFKKTMGFAPAFFHTDVIWSSSDLPSSLAALRAMVASEGIPFGVIYNGNLDDSTSSEWIRSAEQHITDTEAAIGSPDHVIFQSWHVQPKKLLPETDSDSFTSLIDRYFRRRSPAHR